MYLWFLWISFLDHQYSFPWQGNYSVLKSPDEYTVNVESSRGTKEFQFDAIFMEDSTQEKIFEDTNVKTHSWKLVQFVLELDYSIKFLIS